MRFTVLFAIGLILATVIAGCNSGKTVTSDDVNEWQNEGLAEGETADQEHNDGR